MKHLYPVLLCIDNTVPCNAVIDIEQLAEDEQFVAQLLDSAIVKAPDDIISSVTEQYA